ncbi:MAG: rhomboid family intramembrane serine protease [Vicinamibacterales bacterium]
MFVHGGVMHIVSNLVFLAVFAPMVEDAMGRGKFLVFYLLGGLAATAAQIAMDPTSTVPQLGASGAIAGVMGAFLVTYPGDRIKLLWFFGVFAHVSQVPAFVLIGLWLISQMLNQMGAVLEADAGGIAYAAHVGGAFFGILTARLFERDVERGAAPRRAQSA